jgi:hypothetical protein
MSTKEEWIAQASKMEAERDKLRVTLIEIVALHDYTDLDRGIGTALSEGKLWLRARELSR